jgi:hypothetical protein
LVEADNSKGGGADKLVLAKKINRGIFCADGASSKTLDDEEGGHA